MALDVKKRWYVLRAISGKEAKVKEVLDAAIKNTDLGKYVSQVLIPTEKIYTTRNGKKVLKERNLYSGYVFVEAQLTGDVMYELRNTTNVIDFLHGRDKTAMPEPIREDEVARMMGMDPGESIEYRCDPTGIREVYRSVSEKVMSLRCVDDDITTVM